MELYEREKKVCLKTWWQGFDHGLGHGSMKVVTQQCERFNRVSDAHKRRGTRHWGSQASLIMRREN